MKIYLISLGAGLLVGVIYSLLHVRSPAPPVVALVGLLGILIGEQAMPVYRWLVGSHGIDTARHHLFGEMPSAHARTRREDSTKGTKS
ncbi:XapX domain-containing protein [Arenibacterium sp. LLYu02]|uniref:XapX domain-containing protein n=1 Tax=Arenibacterium sp. LLYu02 TaxID=3404132 RepID=UPI003B20DACE